MFFTISIRTPDEKNRITHFVTVPSYFWETKDNNEERKGAQLSGYRLGFRNQRFPVRVGLLAMCKGELFAVIPRLMSRSL